MRDEVSDFDVELDGISRSFGGRLVVRDVCLQVRSGELFTLLGPSGCGKTTLLRIVAGFEQADRGSVRLAGAEMAGVPVAKRDLNMVFQNYALFPHMSVGENVAFGLRMAGRRDVGARVREVLHKVRLAGYEARLPHTLSGGEQQRVALARAIVTSPRVLLLDEPLAALDLKLRKGLREELRRLQRELGMTFVYVTHDQEEALSMSDRIAVLRDGAVQQVGSPREVYERPASRFVAEFVGTANLFEQDGRTVMVRPENVRLASHGMAATVDELLYHGPVTRIVASAGETRIVLDHPDGCPRIGERVNVTWDPQHERVLPL
jgi:ABC-type Fe3+/spermidine/putrescine transport system ATPase subunit